MVSRFCVYPNNGLDSYRSVTVYTGTVLGPSSQLTSTRMCTGYQHIITADTHTKGLQIRP